MTFISYAQNFEDVMLWRALGSIESGFWIDVGAAHPTELSVTRAFYDRGWHGVNIEPEPDYAAALRAERPRDINLQVAIAAVPGRSVLHRIPGTGLSTFDAPTAARHVAAGFPQDEPMEVEVTTLAAVCAAHAPRDIHFLKIDAEGAEREVLLGADLGTYRPWIIVAEATLPLSPVPQIETFSELLAAADYRQCWFDGLNVFFLAAEHKARLAPCFRIPPNVFDAFVPAGQVAADARADAAEHRVVALDRELSETKEASGAAAQRADAAERRVLVLDRELNETKEASAAAAERADAAERRVLALDHELNETKEASAAAAERADAAEYRVAALERELQETREASAAAAASHLAQIGEREAALHRLESEVGRLEAELAAIRNSTSWRLTAPMRAAKRLLAGR
jgi:FkbM family methyltransferase